MLDLVKQLRNANLSQTLNLVAEGKHIGYIPKMMSQKVLEVSPDLFFRTDENLLSLRMNGSSSGEVTDRIRACHEALASEALVPEASGELVDVRSALADPPLFQIDRSLVFPLGMKTWGVHANSRYPNGDFLVAKRSGKLRTFPGCLDVPIGGLVPSGRGIWQQLEIEAEEEAGIAHGTLQPKRDAQVMSYVRSAGIAPVDKDMENRTHRAASPGINWDEVFCWDIDIPDGPSPEPYDGEVEHFRRFSPADLIQSLRAGPEQWKYNSGVMFLQVLAFDPVLGQSFTDADRADLLSLRIADPRPAEARHELRF